MSDHLAPLRAFRDSLLCRANELSLDTTAAAVVLAIAHAADESVEAVATIPDPAWLDLRESQPEVGAWCWIQRPGAVSISPCKFTGEWPGKWLGAATHYAPIAPPPPLPEAT